MASRSDLKNELEALKQLAAKFIGMPMVVGFRTSGEDGETREPGVYGRGRNTTVVLSGDDAIDAPIHAELRKNGHPPLLVGGEADLGAL